MDHHFQLTYSVHPRHDDENSAAKARKVIATEIPSTEKLEKIETTLVGEIPLTSSLDNSEKRKKAEKFIADEVEKILKKHEIYSDVDVYLSLMVDKLGKHIVFDV